MASAAAHAEPPAGYSGQHGWLFYRYEFMQDAEASDTSVRLIARLNALLKANGTQTLLVMAPIKARLYAEELPGGAPLSAALMGQYERLLAHLQSADVATVNLNAAFLHSPARVGEFPLYMRQDTHWSPGGALLAANAIKSALLASPAHQNALALTPPVRYSLAWKPEHWPRVGDLVGMRGPGAPVLKPESVTGFVVTRGRAGGAGLLGDTPPHGITLLGTSYSAEWTQFPAALRHVLQREVLGISVSALSGQWVGLETYLQDDAFQTRRPGLLIWEMPERDLKSPPDFAGRDPRYVMGNAEWLLRAAAWVQQGCAASPHQLSIEPTGLAKAAATGANASAVRASATHDADFIELRFNPAIDRLDYLSARITSKGSKAWRMEASGPAGTNPRRWTQTVAGDETEHALKMPVAVAAAGQGYTKLKIFPGKTAGFALQAAGLCRQPAALLD